MNSILVIAGALALMIIVHELGHLVAARLMGVSAASFAVGFGKRLFRKKVGDVEYSLRLIPLGGFVQLCGMSEDTSHERKQFEREGRSKEEIDRLLKPERLYVNASWWRQIVVTIAGCVMNATLAIAIMTGLLLWRGSSAPTSPLTAHSVVSAVSKNAGLQAGDKIVRCNGMAADRLPELRFALAIKEDNTEITVLRDGRKVDLRIPAREPEWGAMLGIELEGTDRTFSVGSAISEAIDESLGVVQTSYRILFSSHVFKALSSPIGMAHGLHRAGLDELSPLDAFAAFLKVSWVLGISLAFANLLPIPVLDGGHIVFALLKLCRNGREVPLKFKAGLSSAFILMLVGLQCYIVVRDIVGLFK